MLRTIVVAAGVLLLLGAAAFAVDGCPPAAPRLAIPGLLLIVAVLGERWRYQGLQRGRPDPKWVVTEERFVDLESGKPVTVYYQPATGKRRYVTS